MTELLTEDELAVWLPGFFSELSPESPALTPVEVLDPTDGYQSHLYGLGLSVAPRSCGWPRTSSDRR